MSSSRGAGDEALAHEGFADPVAKRLALGAETFLTEGPSADAVAAMAFLFLCVLLGRQALAKK